MSGSEQRQHSRRNLLFYLRVYCVKTGDFLGHAADLSKGGLLLLSEEPVEGEEFELDIRPPAKDAPKNPVHITAEIRWKANHKNPLLYSTGFEITQSQDGDIQNLQDLINKYGAAETEKSNA